MFERVFNLSTLDGSNGFVASGLGINQLGWSVDLSHDINDDGIADYVVSAPSIKSNGKGVVYIIFGNATGFPNKFDLNNLNGVNGFTIIGAVSSGDHFGSAIKTVKDINGDKRNDILISATYANNLSGMVYVIFGQKNFPALLDLKSLNGANGFVVPGTYIGENYLGYSICSAGDVNNDKINDIVLGSYCWRACDHRGVVYVIFGRSNGFPPSLDLNALNGKTGFRVFGIKAYDFLGLSVCGVGDVNGDGIDDLGMTAISYAANNYKGSGYIIFGQNNTFPPIFDLNTLNGRNGFAITGSAGFGRRISPVGDINNDKKDDFAITSINTNYGVVYIIFGRDNVFPAILDVEILDGKNGFVVSKSEPINSALGISIGQFGDVNSDGIDDMGFGASIIQLNTGICLGSPHDAVYVVFGQENFPVNFDVKNLNGTNGFIIPALNQNDCLGREISGKGDINKDGIDDIALGAPSVNNAQGASYVIFGRAVPLKLINNQLIVVQNQSVILSPENLKAIDLRSNATQNNLVFNISEIIGGCFEYIDKPGSITTFIQQAVVDSHVRFVQDASRNVSYEVSVSNGFVSTVPNPANITFQLAPPLLVNNQITIKQGKSVVLTPEYLSATDLNFPAGTLMFSVSEVEGGQFERVNRSDVSIKTFTQQEVMNKQIQFAQDDSKGAGYEVVVTDGNHLSTTPSKANVTFIARPILWQNQLFVKQGSSVVLNRTNINATDDDTPDSGLVITASNVEHGQFEYNNQPDIAVDHFTQENITQLAVRFKTDGGYEKPSYDLTVKDGSDLTDGPYPADVTFHDKPRLGNNKLTVKDGDTTTVLHSDLSAVEKYTPEEKLEFEISDIQHGEFQWKNNSNNAKTSLAITKFFQKNITDQQVQFMHDGSGIAPNYAVSVSDGELTSGVPENATINFQDNSSVDNGLKIGFSIAGVAAGMAVLGLLAYRYYKPRYVVIPEATKKESELDNLMAQDQPSPRSCQLF